MMMRWSTFPVLKSERYGWALIWTCSGLSGLGSSHLRESPPFLTRCRSPLLSNTVNQVRPMVQHHYLLSTNYLLQLTERSYLYFIIYQQMVIWGPLSGNWNIRVKCTRAKLSSVISTMVIATEWSSIRLLVWSLDFLTRTARLLSTWFLPAYVHIPKPQVAYQP